MSSNSSHFSPSVWLQFYSRLFNSMSIYESVEVSIKFIQSVIKADFVLFYIYPLQNIRSSVLNYKLTFSVTDKLKGLLNEMNCQLCLTTWLDQLKQEFELKEITLYPIINRARRLGYFIVGWKKDSTVFVDENIIEILAQQIILGITNIVLNEELLEVSLRLSSFKEDLSYKLAEASIEEISKTLVHELRTPLATIYNSLTQIGRIWSGVKKGEEDKNKSMEILLEAGLEEIRKINNLLIDLVNFSSPRKIEWQLINIKELIDEAIEDAKQKDLEVGGIKKDINFVLINNLPYDEMIGDYNLLKLALLNLITNAIHSIEMKGEIKIVTYLKRPFLVIEIKDSGSGIPTELLNKIFEPFFTTKTYGSGLGLSIVKKIVEGHGGKIEVVSCLGSGSTFTIFLPFRSLID